MPPAKKRRVAAAAAAAAKLAASDDVTAANSAHINKLLQQHRESLDTLLQNVSELSDSGNKVGDDNLSESILSSSLALANLKSLQRQIALQVETQANESKEQRAKVEECSLMLENLTYERNYLQREIGSLEGWKADELEKMAWAEMGRTPPTNTAAQNNEKESSEDVVMGDAVTDDNGAITTSEDAINAYLFGKISDAANNDHRDPTNHTTILQKLQSDLETRSTLVTQLSASKLKLKELQKKREDLCGFLNHQIPQKLGELEKGAESLNSFFGEHSVWKDVLKVDKGSVEEDDESKKKKKKQTANMLVNRPSFDRSKRFQLAKSNLPPPLYVLFVQLVGYRDAWASLEKVGECDGNKSNNALGGFIGASGMDVNIVENNNDDDSDWRVVLSLSISGILPSEVASTFGKVGSSTNSRSSSPTPGGRSSLRVVFSYDKEDGVVYAVAETDGNNDVGNGLLDNLFPDDDGSTMPNVSLSLLKHEEDEDEADSDEGESSNDVMDDTTAENSSENKNGKAYYWCQVLSGLDFPPPSIETNVKDNKAEKDTPFQIQICTKAVMRQLLRRIRARQTLSSMVDFLGRRGQFANPIPIHPTLKSDNNNASNNAPTLKAKLQSWSKEEDMKRYIATIKRKSATLIASVTISDNYPAEPPVWSLQNEDGSVGTASFLQSSINNNNMDTLFDASLHRIECHVNEDLDKFVCQDVEATYDWILIHQLADIVSCWDELQSAKEEGNTRGGNQERLRKGKDRKLIGFGEKSPFFWYRHGL